MLNSQPTASVTIAVSQQQHERRYGESRASVIFTNANWNSPQTVTVTGVDDPPPCKTAISSTPSSPPGRQHRRQLQHRSTRPDVSAKNTDNDSAGFTVSPTANPISRRDPGADDSDTFTIVLNSSRRPTSPFRPPQQQHGRRHGEPSEPHLHAADWNWQLAHTVTVTGVDDNPVQDGNQLYDVMTARPRARTATTTSIDRARRHRRRTEDNDIAEFSLSPTTASSTTEAAGPEPHGDVHDRPQLPADRRCWSRSALRQPARRR